MIQYKASGLMFEHHWRAVVDGVRAAKLDHQFFEIFMYEPVGRHTATVYALRN